jgi:stress response protein SCP2
MAINLQKGQAIDLRKNDSGESFDLSIVTIGLGWHVRRKSSGFFGKLFGGSKEIEYDLDAIAFLLDANGKVANMGSTVQSQEGRQVGLSEGDVVFFNSMRHPSGHIWLTGDHDTRTDGDDERIVVKLDSLNAKYERIVFLATIYQGRQKNQHFSQIDKAFIRAVDNNGKEIARFTLSGNSNYDGMCAMVFSEVYRKDGSWFFKALGEPYPTDNFVELLRSHYS